MTLDRGRINYGLYAVSGSWKTPEYQCDSGNCTFSAYSTLGVCNRCSNITPLIKRTCQDPSSFSNASLGAQCSYTLPNGFTLNPGNGTFLAVNLTQQPITFTNYSNPLALVQTLSVWDTSVNSDSPDALSVAASECALVPCVQTLESTLGSFSVNEREKQEPNKQQPFPESLDKYFEKTLSIYDKFEYKDGLGVFITPPEDKKLGLNGSTYHISNNVYAAWQTYLQRLLQGQATFNGPLKNVQLNQELYNENNFTFAADSNPTAQSDAIQLLAQILQGLRHVCSTEETYGDWPNADQINYIKPIVQCTLSNIAQALTIQMRDMQYYGQSSNNFQRGQPNVVSGAEIGPFTQVTVTWYWIALPIFIWVLSVAMLVGTAWKTRKAGVRTWRTNPLALVFLQLGQDEKNKTENNQSMTEVGLAKKADEMKVQLRITRDGPLLENNSS
jgi:hypothetical protein